MIGRKAEKEIILNAINSYEPQFIAVYGRRRIGKTYLIRETIGEENFTFEHSGSKESTMKSQLERFANSLKEYGLNKKVKLKKWADAFEALKELINSTEKSKKIIFLDEISWMDTKGSDFLPSLENFYNSYVSKKHNIALIICGSATSWIINKVIHNKGGLHNRVTRQIQLMPFTLKECEEYATYLGLSFTRYQIIKLYMVLGGVAYYWSLLQKGLGVEQCIDELFFKYNSPLKDEFEYLYASLFDKPTEYFKIIKLLGNNKKGLTRNEISKKLNKTSSGDLTNKLNDLMYCGFIRKYSSLNSSSHNLLFKLVDNFTIFSLHFLTSNNSEENYFTNLLNTSLLNSWEGIAFETVCLEHVTNIKKALKIEGVASEVASFTIDKNDDKGLIGAQIDLLLLRKDLIIDIFEIKFSPSNYLINKKDDIKIKNRENDVRIITKGKYAIHNVFITPIGIEKGVYSSSVQKVITANDLFD